MKNKILTLLACSVLAAAIGAYAADSPSPGDPSPMSTPAGAGPQRMMHHRGGFRGRGMRQHVPLAVRASIRDINAISRLYRNSGQKAQLAAFYRDVLNKTQNPLLRNYVYLRLARLQSAPANSDAAISTLRRSLDENLSRIESHQRDRDK